MNIGWASQAFKPLAQEAPGAVPLLESGLAAIGVVSRNAVARTGFLAKLRTPQIERDVLAIAAGERAFNSAIGRGIQGAGNAEMAQHMAGVAEALRPAMSGPFGGSVRQAHDGAMRVAANLHDGLGPAGPGAALPDTTHAALVQLRSGIADALGQIGVAGRNGALG